MTTRSWIRNLFASRTPRTIRKVPARRQLHLEQLEDRIALNSYFAATAADLITDIGLANAAGGTNTITLLGDSSVHFTLTAVNNTTDGANGLPVIAAGNNLTIVGKFSTIERNTASVAFRLFDVAAGATLSLQSLALQNGLASGSGVSAQGGAVFSQGTLVLNGVTVQNNTALGSNGSAGIDNTSAVNSYGGPGADAFGGAVYVAQGSVTLTSDTFTGNIAQGGRGGNGGGGGGYGSGGSGGGNGGDTPPGVVCTLSAAV